MIGGGLELHANVHLPLPKRKTTVLLKENGCWRMALMEER